MSYSEESADIVIVTIKLKWRLAFLNLFAIIVLLPPSSNSLEAY